MEKPDTWFCDTCGLIISNVQDGWVEWIEYQDKKGNLKGRDLRLVHSGGKGCQFKEGEEYRRDQGTISDLPLGYFVDTDGLIRLLCFIKKGEIPTDQVLKMIMRLHVPGYEEARKHFDRAIQQGIIAQNLPKGLFYTNAIDLVLAQKWPDDMSALRSKKPKLNLKEGFTKSGLKQLLASCDDVEGHHIIWVDLDGNVDIALIEGKRTPARWVKSVGGRIKFRYQTCKSGKGFVGFEAAKDRKYVSDLQSWLVSDWREDRTGYIGHHG